MWASIRRLFGIWRYPFGRFLAFVSILVGLTGGAAGIWPLFEADQELHALVQSIALATISVAALVALAYRELRAAQEKGVARALENMSAASFKLRDLYSFMVHELEKKEQTTADVKQTLARAREMLINVLDEYAHAFAAIAGTRCRLCIKMIGGPEDPHFVYTLARDSLSWDENREHDEARQSEQLDKLSDNTDFLLLQDPQTKDEGYFFSNNLKSEPNYCSSSFAYWSTTASNPNTHSPNAWRLPYQSTIVWPIRQDTRPELGYTQPRLIGFLALDANISNAFDRNRDIYMGRPLADALYLVLEPWSRLAERATTLEGTARD